MNPDDASVERFSVNRNGGLSRATLFSAVLLSVLSPSVGGQAGSGNEEVAPVPAEERVDMSQISNEALMIQLGSEVYSDRVAAMSELWSRGGAALDSLRSVADGDDPEVSLRARELIFYITAGVLPDSPDEVKELVLAFSRSPIEEKLTILKKLMELEQWHQVLHLANSERDPNSRVQMSSLVKRAASQAARSAIAKGDYEAAAEVLELTDDSEENLMMRAWFYVRRGQMQEQLTKAAGMKGRKGAIWRTALYRAGGDLKAAVKEAEKSGLHGIAVGLRVLKGDALPWLEMNQDGGRLNAILSTSYQIQKARIEGQQRNADIMARELAGMANDENSMHQAAMCLAANGYGKAAVELISKSNVELAFEYYDGIESPELGLKVLGIPEEATAPYTDWVKTITQEAINDDDYSQRLLVLAGFLNRHGEKQHAVSVLSPLMEHLEKDGADSWFDLLNHMRSYDLGWIAFQFAQQRGNDDNHMDLSVKSILGSSEQVSLMWDLLKERQGSDNIDKALHHIALLSGLIPDTNNETDDLHQALVKEIMKDNPNADALKKPVGALLHFAVQRNNLVEVARLLDLVAPQNEEWKHAQNFYDEALHKWKKAEPTQAQKAKDRPDDYVNLIKWSISLRKLGRAEAAEKVYERAMMMTLGTAEGLEKIGSELSSVGYDEEAVEILELSAMLAPVKSAEFQRAIINLAYHGDQLYQSGHWAKAAAINEVYCSVLMRGRSNHFFTQVFRVRFYAEFSSAMSQLEAGQRDQAIEKLDKARQLIPGDGSLADHFFPVLRNAGIGKYYDEWFEDSYRHIKAACDAYPASHNSHNTAAWLASRALRRLDDAHQHAEAALSAKPLQGAYLDTMAEIWFARGDRPKAIEWSEKAVAASIGNAQGSPRVFGSVIANYSQLGKQLQRFKLGEMPK